MHNFFYSEVALGNLVSETLYTDKDICTRMFAAVLLVIAKDQEPPSANYGQMVDYFWYIYAMECNKDNGGSSP